MAIRYMKKTFHINLRFHFGDPAPAYDLRMDTDLMIRHADRQCYQSARNEAVLEEFDGRHGYLYSLAVDLRHPVAIPLCCEQADIHVLYLMDGEAAPVQLTHGSTVISRLTSHRARYLYLSPGDYLLHLSAGCSHLFGFYFDGGIFRDGNDREFPFLSDVLSRYRAKHREPFASIDFSVGPKTKSAIQQLRQRLKRGSLGSEKFIYDTLLGLIELSKEKVFDEYVRESDPRALIQRCRNMLREAVAKDGIKAQIKGIASRLRVSAEYLSRLHRQYYAERLSAYRNDILTAKIKALLHEDIPLQDIAHLCGFTGQSEMNRFFKRNTGSMPRAYRDSFSR